VVNVRHVKNVPGPTKTDVLDCLRSNSTTPVFFAFLDAPDGYLIVFFFESPLKLGLTAGG
jgi:hypothetical protein